MPILVTGSEGNIGCRLMAAFPGAVGLDIRPGADIVADLATLDYSGPDIRECLATTEAVVHLATSADPDAPEAVHWQAVANTARLVAACAAVSVPRIVLASSAWAEPRDGRPQNAYGGSKAVFEALAAMYAVAPGRVGIALRIGWVPGHVDAVAAAPDWLRASYWDDARLIAAFSDALGLAT